VNFSMSKTSRILMKFSNDRSQLFSGYGQKGSPLFSSSTSSNNDAVVNENNNKFPPISFKESSSSFSSPVARTALNSDVILQSKFEDVSSNSSSSSRQFHWNISSQPFPEEVCKVLLNPLNDKDIEVKPDGHLYLPEIKYRRILNQAFGPGGWGLMPFGNHKVEGGYLWQEYGLFCYGQYVSQAYGEQQFDESKFGSRSVSTALEGAKSNSLMRCCKDLGVASELWDPQFILQWLSKYVVKVMCEHQVSKQKKVLFRRMDRPMFEYPWKEISVMETNTKKKPPTSNSNLVGEQQQQGEDEEGSMQQMGFEGLDASVLNPDEDSISGSSSSNPGILLEDEDIEELNNAHPSVSRNNQKAPFSSSSQHDSPIGQQQQSQTNVIGGGGGMISSALFQDEEAKVLSSSGAELDLDAVDMFGSFQQMQEQKQQQHNSNIRNSTSANTTTTTGSRRPLSQRSVADTSTPATTTTTPNNSANNRVVGGGGTSGFALDKEVRFGKHKGKSWRDVLDEPGIQDYLQWLATKGATPFIRQTGIDALNHLQKGNNQ